MKHFLIPLALVLLNAQACTQIPITSAKNNRASSKNVTTPKSQPKIERPYDENKYRPIVDTLKKMYGKEQFLYNRSHIGSAFVFQFVPISLFPMFCISENFNPKGDFVYIYGIQYSAYRLVNGIDYDHIKIGVVSYIKSKGWPPTKTYKLHSFFFNPVSNQWEEEDKPLVVVLELTDPVQCFYGCRTTKKSN